MRLGDSSSEQSDAMDGMPQLTQCFVHPDVSPSSTATPSATPDDTMSALAPSQKDRLGRVMIEPGWIILNGLGGVFRDSRGNWIAGFYKRGKGVNHIHMELQALLQGLEVAIARELIITEVETDATEVIKQIQHPSPLFSNIVNECRYALRKLGNPKIRHNFREGNTVAHTLATEGHQRATTNEVMLLVEPQPWAEDCLNNDSFGGYTTRKMKYFVL
ncbi:hypothetical protein RDI58_028953 [Solanum bulbocastanum]|uniref:RNase H type-1 domain-containing protein n=1 Tax=Solanum bulbocastanum TaxID=147425 RepID=A0AAN8SSU9_SOLBU